MNTKNKNNIIVEGKEFPVLHTYEYHAHRALYSEDVTRRWISNTTFLETEDNSDTFGRDTVSSSYTSVRRVDGKAMGTEDDVLDFIKKEVSVENVLAFINNEAKASEIEFLAIQHNISSSEVKEAFLKACRDEAEKIYSEKTEWESISPYGGEDVGHIYSVEEYAYQEFEGNSLGFSDRDFEEYFGISVDELYPEDEEPDYDYGPIAPDINYSLSLCFDKQEDRCELVLTRLKNDEDKINASIYEGYVGDSDGNGMLTLLGGSISELFEKIKEYVVKAKNGSLGSKHICYCKGFFEDLSSEEKQEVNRSCKKLHKRYWKLNDLNLDCENIKHIRFFRRYGLYMCRAYHEINEEPFYFHLTDRFEFITKGQARKRLQKIFPNAKVELEVIPITGGICW